MTSQEADAESDAGSPPPWGLLGVGGAVSLCCLFAAPAAGGVAGATTTALGGGLVRILVTALTVGTIGAVYCVRSSGCACGTSGNPEA